jgi:hypothetical protein
MVTLRPTLFGALHVGLSPDQVWMTGGHSVALESDDMAGHVQSSLPRFGEN